MKVTYWSSTEYSGFLEGLVRELTYARIPAGQRFQISEGSYRSAKSSCSRLFLRFRQYVAYPVQLLFVLLKRRVFSYKKVDDVCVVSTNTFYAPLLAICLHPNVVHLVYDLFPEAMIHSGKWKEGALKVKVVRWITQKTLLRSKCNVFLGQRLKDYVESIHGHVPNSIIIPVGADQSLFQVSPKQRLSERDGQGESLIKKPLGAQKALLHSTLTGHPAPTVLYCGNFGNMHDSETLFHYWKRVSENEGLNKVALDQSSRFPNSIHQLRWRFHCSGPKRAALEELFETLSDQVKATIRIGEGLSQSEWVETMEQADVALVTMAPGAETVVMPSKTYSAMMAGQAILAIAPEESDLVDLIKEANCGWWVKPGDVIGLEQAIAEILNDSDALLEKRERAFLYAHKRFGQDSLAKEWIDLIEHLVPNLKPVT
ncbi:MAG: glycosyltransferase [Verrucomicrobiota bacterium]